MSRILMPATYLQEGRQLWGYVRVIQEEGPISAVKVEVQSMAENTRKRWIPFCTLSVADGKLIFAFHGRPDQPSRTGVFDATTGVATPLDLPHLEP